MHNRKAKRFLTKKLLYDLDTKNNDLLPIISSPTSNGEVNVFYHQYFQSLNDTLNNIVLKEEAKKHIENIKFLFQVKNFTFDISDLTLLIQILFKIFIKFDEFDVEHEILNLVDIITQHNKLILEFIVEKTDFVQIILSKIGRMQIIDEKISFIHFLLTMTLTENKDIINFFSEHSFIEFICLEFQEFTSPTYDHQDPYILSILTNLINNLFHFYSSIQFLSKERIFLILHSFLMIIQNENDFYLFDLYVDDIILSLLKSIKYVNPSLFLECGLCDQLLLNLYSIEDYKFDKELIFLFFINFIEINIFDNCLTLFLDRINFELICKTLLKLNDHNFYCYYINLFKAIIQTKKKFIEILYDTNFFNFFLSKADDLSYRSKTSFWSLILVIFVDFPLTYSKALLDNQQIINSLFEFLRISDKDFIVSHLEYLAKSTALSSQYHTYYQNCLNEFITFLNETEPEFFDNLQEYISQNE